MEIEAFERELKVFMERQLAECHGERHRRLAMENRYAEELFLRNVWWPLFGNFEYLDAEWEVPDLGAKGFRYLDYAYRLPPLRIAVEIEGFGPHAKNADRRKFEDDHLRAAYLQAEGWKVLRFSFDTVKERPELCRQILSLLLGRWSAVHAVGDGDGGQALGRSRYSDWEKEVIRIAIARQQAITPGEVSVQLGVCVHTARRRLRDLTNRGVFRVASGSSRARSYALRSEVERLFYGMED